jgi:hypothetical protein
MSKGREKRFLERRRQMADTRECKVLITGDAAGLTAASTQGAEGLKKFKEMQISVAQSASDGMNPAMVAASEGMKKTGEEVEKLTFKKKDLKAAIKGLREEFPLLAHIGRLALNPITFAVAAAAGAFEVWQNRLETLKNAMAGVELPDSKATDPGHINAVAAGWERYAEALHSAVESYNSIDAASDRAMAKLEKELEQQKKLLEAVKGRELAELELRKGSMTEGAYGMEKAGIEQRYADAGLNMDHQGAQQKYDVKLQRGMDLAREAAAKRAEASQIRVASQGDDAATEADLKARSDTAEKSIAERKQRIADLRDYQAGEGKFGGSVAGMGNRAWFAAKTMAGYGVDVTAQGAIDIEQQGLQADEPNVARYREFQQRAAGRALQRKRRDELLAGAGKAEGESRNIGESLAGDREALRRQTEVDSRVGTAGMANRLEGTPIGAMASEDMRAAEKTAAALNAHKNVSDQSRQELVDIASAVAGHQVSLKQAVGMMAVASKNFGVFTNDVLRLVGSMQHMATAQEGVGRKVTLLEEQVKRLKGMTTP